MAVTLRELLEAAGALGQRGSEVGLRNAASPCHPDAGAGMVRALPAT